MSHFRHFIIDQQKHFDAPVEGALKVYGQEETRTGLYTRPAGWLMPELSDSRQQPKSLAAKLIEARNASLRPAE